MSIDTQELRKLAEAAIPDTLILGPEVGGFVDIFGESGGPPIAQRVWVNDAAYIAAFSPDVALSLLDTIEDLQRQKGDLLRITADHIRTIEELRTALQEVVNLSAGPLDLTPVEQGAISIDLLRRCYSVSRAALASKESSHE
jgi:hypothetical protein